LAKAREHGGTVKAYAEANGLSAGVLYAAKSAEKVRDKRARSRTTTAARLLPVQLATVAPPAPVRIALPNGMRIEVPSTLSADEWRPLLTLLSSGT